MPNQKTIANFFKPLAAKRQLTTEVGSLPKKHKVDLGTEALEYKIKEICESYPIIHANIGQSWFKGLQNEFEKPYFKKLCDFVTAERSKHIVYPPADKVWTWTQMCSVSEVKVVILGQDPYHNPQQAHGLSFSVPNRVNPPPSLFNMYKELQSDIPGFVIPKHGTLTGWAKQGVLLLNACLTVKANCANSHKDQGWERLTDSVIRLLSDSHRGIVFLLWGAYAQKKASFVDKNKHHILKTVHPSPLSAHRGFLGCKHFSQCNVLLEKEGRTPINWGDLPQN